MTSTDQVHFLCRLFICFFFTERFHWFSATNTFSFFFLMACLLLPTLSSCFDIRQKMNIFLVLFFATDLCHFSFYFRQKSLPCLICLLAWILSSWDSHSSTDCCLFQFVFCYKSGIMIYFLWKLFVISGVSPPPLSTTPKNVVLGYLTAIDDCHCFQSTSTCSPCVLFQTVTSNVVFFLYPLFFNWLLGVFSPFFKNWFYDCSGFFLFFFLLIP